MKDENTIPESTGETDADLETMRQERDSLYDRLARTTAEFQNARRRLEADKEQAVTFANASLIKKLLSVIDNFERALAVDTSGADAGKILKGMQMVHDQWMTVLKEQNVETVSPKLGDPFDPATMEAIMHQDGDYPANTVTQLLQTGYTLHGRTLRPAQVAVSKPE